MIFFQAFWAIEGCIQVHIAQINCHMSSLASGEHMVPVQLDCFNICSLNGDNARTVSDEVATHGDASNGWGFCLSSWTGSSMMAVGLSSLDVSAIGNLVGRKITFSTGTMALVDGVKMLHCLWWCIAGLTCHLCVPLSDHVVFLFSFG